MAPDRSFRDERTHRRPAEAEPERGRGPVSRRSLLRLGAVGVGALAGCFGGATPPDPRSTRATPTDWSPPDDQCEVDAVPDGAPRLVTEFDAREQFRCLSDPLDEMETLDPWTATGGTVTADEEYRVTGTQSAHVRADGEADRVSIHRPLPGGIDMFDRNPSVAVRAGESAPLGAYVQLFAPDARNRLDLWQTVGSGSWVRLDPGPTRVVGNPNLTDVRRIGISVWTGGEELDFRIDSVRTTEKPDEGYAVFTFDDSYASHYEEALPILDEHGFGGVIGAVPDAVGRDGRTSLEQLGELDRAGWDVVNHPQVGSPLSDLSTEDRRREIREAKQWLLDNGFESGVNVAIWPRGTPEAGTVDVAADYYHLAFGGGRSTNGVPFTNPLTVNRIDGTDLDRTRRLLEFAAEHRTLAVPRYYAIDGRDISAGEFRETVEYADELDLSVVTASELWIEGLP